MINRCTNSGIGIQLYTSVKLNDRQSQNDPWQLSLQASALGSSWLVFSDCELLWQVSLTSSKYLGQLKARLTWSEAPEVRNWPKWGWLKGRQIHLPQVTHMLGGFPTPSASGDFKSSPF